MTPMMMQAEFPLLDFFITLNKAGLPIGIDNYMALLRALQGGFGHDVEALKRTCNALWITSPDEEHLFNFHFAHIEPELKRRLQQVEEEVQQHAATPLEDTFDSKSDAGDDFDLDLDLDDNVDLDLTDDFSTRDESVEESGPPAKQPEREPQDSSPLQSSELLRIQDETQVVQAVTAIQVEAQDIELPYVDAQFVLSGNYLPITKRQMKQSWRYLRRFVRDGACEELDIDATIHDIGRQGFFLKPVMVPRRLNKVELLLLLDHNGSMTPFHALTERLKESAIRGGRLKKASVYYFHNVPGERVYHSPAMLEFEDTGRIISRLHALYGNVIIVSDAGAARGWFNEERLERTLAFLDVLRAHTANIAWLNPMPESRWIGTTAGAVQQAIPMFEMSRRGLDLAISALRRGI